MPGPSNLYGISNPTGVVATGFMGGAVTCPPGVQTIVSTWPAMYAPSSGYFYPIIWGQMQFVIGATVPGDLHFGFLINGGSIVDQMQTDTQIMPANSTINLEMYLVGTPSNTAWVYPGSVITFFVNPLGQSVGFRGYSAKTMICLFRAPDQ